MNTTKNRIILFVVIGLAAILIIGGIVVATNGNNADSPAKLLSLGEKYLSELNYEQAVVQFLKVIAIEPMNERAYIGAAEAYIGLGQNDKAIEVLERGLAMLPESAEMKRMLEGLMPTPEPEPLTAQEIAAVERQEFRSHFLEKLHALFESGLVDDALALVNNTSDFAAQCEDVDETNPDLYIPEGKKGIGIYKANQSRFGDYYIYYGDFANEIRSGSGFWAIVNNDEYYLFEGLWGGDSPNGYGEIKEWYGTLHEGMTYRQKNGILVNGLWNGEMEWNFIYPDETNINPVNFTGGIVTVFDPYTADDGRTAYYVSDTMSFYEADIAFHHGVAGFEDYRG